MTADAPAFQDRIPDNRCWGCGPLNEQGLHVKSRWEGGAAVCTWQPASWHMAGPPHILNGGIIATIIDCHTVCTVIAAMYRAERREIGTRPHIWCATGSLQIRYRRPTPIDAPVQLHAQIIELSERKGIVSCSLLSDGELCASADVVAVRVSEEWRHGAP